jgi:hypothetical protein
VIRELERERQRADENEKLLLQFIASLTLCDHMGDVCDDINVVLDALSKPMEWDDLHDLGRQLGKLGITTLGGIELTDEDEPQDETL